jgi:hypothetical protein
MPYLCGLRLTQVHDMTSFSNVSSFFKIPPSFSLTDFSPNLNAKLSFSTVSAYATAVFQHLLTVVFQHQHMLQPGVSASAHSGVSASAYATAWCFSIYSALYYSVFSIYYSGVSA